MMFIAMARNVLLNWQNNIPMKSIRFSLKYLSKARGSNLTRIISLTLGLAVSLLIFSYVSFLLSFNRSFPDKERLYQAWSLYGVQGIELSKQMNAPLAPSMKQDMPQIEAATHTFGTFDYDMKVDESFFPTSTWAADTSFCDVFGIERISGETPREIFTTTDKIMIAQSLAETAFPGKDPIGAHVVINNQLEFTIAGVFKDLPINSTLGKFNVLAPFDYMAKTAQMNVGWNGGDSFLTFFKLVEGARIEEIEAQIPAFIEKYGLKANMEQWQQEYLFTSIAKSPFMEGNQKEMVTLLSALAFLLLFVATMNYVLVSISGLVQRSRTIALLKCNGAHRRDIFRIFLAETLLLILCAILLAALLLLGFAKPIEQLTSYPMAELFSWHRLWAPGSVLVAAFLLAGIIPARIFTKVPVEDAFRGTSDSKRLWKRVLLGVEMACITCVIALLWITTLQFKQLRDGDFGYDPHNLVFTMFMGRPTQYEQYVQELEALPEVESVGHAYQLPIYGYGGMPCIDEESRELLFSCRWEMIDRHYIPTMKMELVDGANFTEASRPTDVIVNQEYVRLRGWTESPIGREIRDDYEDPTPLYTIVGVVKDFRMEADGVVQPIVMHNCYELMTVENHFYGGIRTMIRMHEITGESLSALQEKVETYQSANSHLVITYADLLKEQLTPIRSLRNIIGIGSAITLLIALIGLLGYLNDECNRRGREIAIRKVNGATVNDILQLLGRNMLVLSLISISIGLVVAYFAADKILQQYATRISLHAWIFIGSAAIVLAIIYLIQFAKTWRAAHCNPSLMIKSE